MTNTDTTISPTEELAQLKARQTAAKLAFEQDQKATEQRVAALFELQRPLHESLEKRYQLRRGIARCEKFHQVFSEDAFSARQTWHREVQSPSRQERGPLYGINDVMIKAESCKAECAKSLQILREDLAEMEGVIFQMAKESGHEALLPPLWPLDPIDE